jgi:hypothetical protein
LGECNTLVNYVEVVIGWKVAKELPSWVDDAIACEGFLMTSMMMEPNLLYFQKIIYMTICLLIQRSLS